MVTLIFQRWPWVIILGLFLSRLDCHGNRRRCTCIVCGHQEDEFMWKTAIVFVWLKLSSVTKKTMMLYEELICVRVVNTARVKLRNCFTQDLTKKCLNKFKTYVQTKYLNTTLVPTKQYKYYTIYSVF